MPVVDHDIYACTFVHCVTYALSLYLYDLVNIYIMRILSHIMQINMEKDSIVEAGVFVDELLNLVTKYYYLCCF